MPQLKLTYFDMDGGRGEPIRLAFSIGGIAFEDNRFPLADFPERKTQMPLNQVPVLEVDGEMVTQTNAMLRYAGALAGLLPEEPLALLHCDETLDVVEGLVNWIVVTFGIEDPDALRTAREALVAGPMNLYLGRLQHMLQSRGGRYFAGDEFSVADLKVFVLVKSLRSGRLEHVPTDLVDRTAPALAAHCDAIGRIPAISDYYAKRAANA